MRYQSCVASLSWIPSEAVTGGTRAAFDAGFTHYDGPPPVDSGISRKCEPQTVSLANILQAWIEVDDSGRITGSGYGKDGRGLIGATAIRLAGLRYRNQANEVSDLRRDPELGNGWGPVRPDDGRPDRDACAPQGRRRPFVQWQAPMAWTTLSLTLHADGRAEFGIPGASRFPRHWVYDGDGRLARKSGLAEGTGTAGRSAVTAHGATRILRRWSRR